MTTLIKRNNKREKKPVDSDREARRAAIAAARGSLAWVNYSVDDFLRDKRKEVDRENHE
jgi:hypothetical protein